MKRRHLLQINASIFDAIGHILRIRIKRLDGGQQCLRELTSSSKLKAVSERRHAMAQIGRIKICSKVPRMMREQHENENENA